MVRILVTIYDMVSESYSPPNMFHTKGAALRSFQDAVNTKDTAFNKNPEDFVLFKIGEFDESVGELYLCEREKIANASALIIKE